MKNIIAFIFIIIAAGSMASDKSRPGANNGSVIEQPAQKPLDNNQVQEEQDFRTDAEIRKDQARREKENARRLKEERIRRNQRYGVNNGFVP